MSEPQRIELRGYRRVFNFERRLFHFHNWRIPYPHGVPLRAIGYFVAFEFAALVGRQLPGLALLSVVAGPAVTFLVVPLAGAFVLMQVRIDGRPPHHVLVSLIRFKVRSRSLAGLNPAPPVGSQVEPLDDLTVAYDGRESFVVPGRIRGPARVTFRYPSEGTVEGAPRWIRDPERRKGKARRFRIRRRPDGRPMLRGKVVTVPADGEVVVE
jgi:hypothetical protein